VIGNRRHKFVPLAYPWIKNRHSPVSFLPISGRQGAKKADSGIVCEAECGWRQKNTTYFHHDKYKGKYLARRSQYHRQIECGHQPMRL
jgi:hypothetical protein